MSRHLFVFRPGEEARLLARCQFGASVDGRCGAFLTYPIKGYPWRRNPRKSVESQLTPNDTELLFAEPSRILAQYPEHCLPNEALWSDSSEKANSITRDRATNTLCWTVGVMAEHAKSEAYFALRENSPALTNSALYRHVMALIAPYEQLTHRGGAA